MNARAGSGTSVSSTTTTSRYTVTRRPRRWLALIGLVPLIGGVIETNSRIETDLEAKAIELGATTADFTAQAGAICVEDFDAFADRLREVRGVGSVERDSGCAQVDESPVSTAADAAPSTESTPEPTASTPTSSPTSTAPPATTTAPAADIVDSLVDRGSFSTLTELVGVAGLEGTLRSAGPLTIFAPTDEAFAKLDPALVERLRADPALLSTVLTYHAVSGAVRAADLTSGEVEAVSGETLVITVGDGVTIDANGSESAEVIEPDIEASNGIIHAIDTVLVPPSLRLEAEGATALDASATFDGARIVLTGTVDNEAQRELIVAAAVDALDGDASRVDDQLAVAATPPADAVDAADERAAQLSGLLATLPTNFASGTASVSDVVSLRGLALDEAAVAAAAADAAAAGAADADVQVEVRPEATAADRDQLIADINALFVDQTIQFAPSSAEILDESSTLLDDAAARLLQFDLSGIVIVIEGHTDADGSSESNLTLSQQRAEAVQQALVERGIDSDALDPVGFGEAQPVAPNDTDANKALNRRVTLSAQQ